MTSPMSWRREDVPVLLFVNVLTLRLNIWRSLPVPFQEITLGEMVNPHHLLG
jgi:hypothetical protein